MTVSMQDMIERAARNNPRGECLRYRDTSHDRAEVRDRIAKLAGALQVLCLDNDDRITLLSLDSANYY